MRICKYIVLLLFVNPLSVYALDIEFKGSITGKSGNTNSNSQLLQNSITSVFKANTIRGSVAYNRDSKDHVTYSEGYKLHIIDEYKFTAKNGGYIKYEFYRDIFRGYEGQNKYGLGHLFYWNKYFKTRTGYEYYGKKNYLIFGYIFNYEIFKSKLDYVRSSSLEYDINFNAGLRFKLFSYFSLEFNYDHIYKNNPKEGFSKTDSKYYTMLVVSK